MGALFWFYTAIDGFRGYGVSLQAFIVSGSFFVSGGYFTLMMVVRGFRPLAFALTVILPGAALERTMSWHLPW